MERIQSLINKLQEQYSQHADPSQMQMTLQLLQGELNYLKSNGAKKLGTSKVSVTMPSSANVNIQRVQPQEKVKESNPYAPQPKSSERHMYPAFQFDPLVEIPTLSHQEGVMEINQSVAQQRESLNDKLYEKKIEVMESFKDSPIQDLRKGIGINDRYHFISDLFRGDEPMYERSIKTINSFNLYSEAEHWMNRELKVKLGWDENRETVSHFYDLVRRRFI